MNNPTNELWMKGRGEDGDDDEWEESRMWKGKIFSM